MFSGLKVHLLSAMGERVPRVDLAHLPARLCGGLLRLLQEEKLDAECMHFVKELLVDLVQSDDQLRQGNLLKQTVVA